MNTFKQSLIRGTKEQTKVNTFKAELLIKLLEEKNVESLEELDYTEVVEINVLVSRLGAKKKTFKESEAIGKMIESDREKKEYKGND